MDTPHIHKMFYTHPTPISYIEQTLVLVYYLNDFTILCLIGKVPKTLPQLARWHSSSRRAGDEEVKLCHLRTGHTFATQTHRYLLFDERRPSCPHCEESLSISRVLDSCRNLASTRARFFGRNSFTLEELIGDASPFIGNVAHLEFSIV